MQLASYSYWPPYFPSSAQGVHRCAAIRHRWFWCTHFPSPLTSCCPVQVEWGRRPIPKTPIANNVYDAVLWFIHPTPNLFPSTSAGTCLCLTHTHAYLLAARVRVTTYPIIRNLLAIIIILQFRVKLLPSCQQMRLARFAWRNAKKPAALARTALRLRLSWSTWIRLLFAKGMWCAVFLIIWGMVRMLIHRGRLFTMFAPPLPTFNGARECGKHISTEGHQFLSRSRNHHHNNRHQHSCRSKTFILPSNLCRPRCDR